MTLKSVVKFLLDNGYAVIVKGKFRFTARFNQEVSGNDIGVVKTAEGGVVVKEEVYNWSQRFMNFILDSKIPKFSESSDGTVYALNKYNEEAAKLFRKMLEKERVNYEILVQSTELYYKSKSKFKMTIGNYIESGAWRTDYEELLTRMQSGTEREYFNQQLKDGTHNSYELG